MNREQIKRVEENAISMLRMRRPKPVDLKEEIGSYLREVFLANHTMLAKPTMDRLTRFLVNLALSSDIGRINADEVLLVTFSNLGMGDLVNEYKHIIK